MKKVDIIHGGWLKAPNGASSVLRTLAESTSKFEEYGIQLSVYSMDLIVLKSFENIAAINQRKGLRYFIKKNANANSILAFISIYAIYLRHARKIVKYYFDQGLEESRILFIHDIFTCYYYLKYRSRRQKTVLVLHNNGDTFNMLRQYYPVLNKSRLYSILLYIERKVLSEVDKVLFVAENPKDTFVQLHPDIPIEKVGFVYNGILSKEMHICLEKHLGPLEICCVGSVSKRKGQDMIVEALVKMSPVQREKVHFTIVGDGTLRGELEKLCFEKGISKYIDFIGVSNQVENYLLRSDIFMLPSRDEGFPISILEAMRAGLPIISTNIAGIPEMVFSGINGIVISPCLEDIYDILCHIESYNWSAMGKLSYELYQQKFTLDSMIESYANILNAI